MGIARKIVVSANGEGLVLQPVAPKGQRTPQSLLIKYGDAPTPPTPRDGVPDPPLRPSSFEAFGVIGLISVFRQSFLITITRREQVAQIRGFPVYVVTGVAITPCSSQTEAASAIAAVAGEAKSGPAHKPGDDADTSDEDEEALQSAIDDVEDVIDESDLSADSPGPGEPVDSTFAEDVIRRRGSFGRFAQQWFSKKGWVQSQKRSMGLSKSTVDSPISEATADTKASRNSEDSLETTASALLPKLLHTAQILFGSSRSFYFSYDFDITRKWGECKPFAHDQPLHAQVAPTYFWNNHLLEPFLTNGAESVALPLMQGFVGQKSFVMDQDPPQVDDSEPEAMEMSSFSLGGGPALASPPSEVVNDAPRRPSERDFLITLISRRSTKRAGLRYLRRGIDEDGHTANTVETEQILSTSCWNSSPAAGGSKIYSFVQLRGSIPVFFTQSPFSFKPVPVLQHSEDANLAAMKKHFDELRPQYGSIHLLNLVEKGNTEAVVGNAYSEYVAKVNEDLPDGEKIPFEWFDFHHACRGMKFENVSWLLEKIRGTFDEFGSTIESDGEVVRRQGGVTRMNCMDCLDRTNVSQSTFGRYMLDAQLRAEGFDVSAPVNQNTWQFNNIWADNGDAVSNQYASTAAMKGDYTRTRKRDYRGTLNDLGLSITRFYNGIVNDYFSQMAIDFLLGNVTALVFAEFESDMMTKDPAISVVKKREQAIQLCRSRVIADESEEFVAGWAMLTPEVPGAISGQPLEEAVFLLTDSAMYLCRFNWDLDRVSSFERVDLAHVEGIKMGAYITSTVSPVHTDEEKNVGFVVSYQPGKDDFTRTNTRTLSSLGGERKSHRTSPGGAGSGGGAATGPFAGFFSGRSRARAPPVKKVALKVPYARSSLAKDGDEPRQTELQLMHTMCSEVERLAGQAQRRGEDGEDWGIIEEEDIISLDEAKRSTGIFEQLGHSLKRMVWA